MDALSAKQSSKDGEKQKLSLTRSNLAQIALNPSTLRSLSKLGFERFRHVVVGCFVCMPAIRKNKVFLYFLLGDYVILVKGLSISYCSSY